MSCWVVPSVAAEFWGVSLDVVWSRIYAGQVPHKRDGGFVFVDVAPWAADFNGRVRHNPPPTYMTALATDCEPGGVALAPDELELLGQADHGGESDADLDDEPAASEDELPPLDDEESATFTRLSWEDTRRRVGRTRIPPKTLST